MENFDKFWHLLPKKDADIYFVSRMNFKFVKTLVEHEQPLNLRVISNFLFTFVGAAKLFGEPRW